MGNAPKQPDQTKPDAPAPDAQMTSADRALMDQAIAKGETAREERESLTHSRGLHFLSAVTSQDAHKVGRMLRGADK